MPQITPSEIVFYCLASGGYGLVHRVDLGPTPGTTTFSLDTPLPLAPGETGSFVPDCTGGGWGVALCSDYKVYVAYYNENLARVSGWAAPDLAAPLTSMLGRTVFTSAVADGYVALKSRRLLSVRDSVSPSEIYSVDEGTVVALQTETDGGLFYPANVYARPDALFLAETVESKSGGFTLRTYTVAGVAIAEKSFPNATYCDVVSIGVDGDFLVVNVDDPVLGAQVISYDSALNQIAYTSGSGSRATAWSVRLGINSDLFSVPSLTAGGAGTPPLFSSQGVLYGFEETLVSGGSTYGYIREYLAPGEFGAGGVYILYRTNTPAFYSAVGQMDTLVGGSSSRIVSLSQGSQDISTVIPDYVPTGFTAPTFTPAPFFNDYPPVGVTLAPKFWTGFSRTKELDTLEVPEYVFYRPVDADLPISAAAALASDATVSSAAITPTSFSVSPEIGSNMATCLAVNGNGDKVYVTAFVGGNDALLHEYEVVDPQDLATATPTGITWDVGYNVYIPYGMVFNANGDQIVFSDSSSFNILALNGPYDFTTPVAGAYVGYGVTSGVTYIYDLDFANGGNQVFAIYNSNVYSWPVSVPWTPSTANLGTKVSQALSNVFGLSRGLAVKEDGSALYVANSNGGVDTIRKYNMTTPGDLTTLVFDQAKDYSAYGDGIRQLALTADETALFALFDTSKTVVKVAAF